MGKFGKINDIYESDFTETEYFILIFSLLLLLEIMKTIGSMSRDTGQAYVLIRKTQSAFSLFKGL